LGQLYKASKGHLPPPPAPGLTPTPFHPVPAPPWSQLHANQPQPSDHSFFSRSQHLHYYFAYKRNHLRKCPHHAQLHLTAFFSFFLQCRSCQVSTKVNLSRYFATPTGLLKSHDILKEHNITCGPRNFPNLAAENSKSTCKINWHKSPHVFIPIYIHMTLPSSTFQKQSCPIQALTKTKTSSTTISIIILIILIFNF